MKPPPFAYAAADSLEEALALLSVGDEAKPLAGGQSLLPLLAYRIVRPTHLVDLNGVHALEQLRDDDGLVVGALVRHADLERAALPQPWRALSQAARSIGHLPIRIRGTFGGSLAHADPAAELPVVATALDAQLALASTSGVRVVPAEKFFLGPHTTALEPGELLVEARLPEPPDGSVTAFVEVSERAGDFALVAVCAGLGPGWARLAVGGAGAVPVRAHAAERLLSEGGAAAAADAARAAVADCEPWSDRHASAATRRELVEVLTRRAVGRLVSAA